MFSIHVYKDGGLVNIHEKRYPTKRKCQVAVEEAIIDQAEHNKEIIASYEKRLQNSVLDTDTDDFIPSLPPLSDYVFRAEPVE